jgi:hypothetical protein
MKPENLVFEHYHEFAEKINPIVQAALAGRLNVPEQKQFSEAWLGLALFGNKGIVPLEEIIGSADALNHKIPTGDEVAWAFLRLKTRGWLEVKAGSYGLTLEGRRAIDIIVSQDHLKRLNEWMSSNPPSGPLTHLDVFLALGRSRAKSD